MTRTRRDVLGLLAAVSLGGAAGCARLRSGTDRARTGRTRRSPGGAGSPTPPIPTPEPGRRDRLYLRNQRSDRVQVSLTLEDAATGATPVAGRWYELPGRQTVQLPRPESGGRSHDLRVRVAAGVERTFSWSGGDCGGPGSEAPSGNHDGELVVRTDALRFRRNACDAIGIESTGTYPPAADYRIDASEVDRPDCIAVGPDAVDDLRLVNDHDVAHDIRVSVTEVRESGELAASPAYAETVRVDPEEAVAREVPALGREATFRVRGAVGTRVATLTTSFAARATVPDRGVQVFVTPDETTSIEADVAVGISNPHGEPVLGACWVLEEE